MEETRRNRIWTRLVKHLRRNKVSFVERTNGRLLEFGSIWDNGNVIQVSVWCSPRENLMVVDSMFPVLVPPGKRAAIMEAMVRANARQQFGAFQLDVFRAGELHFSIGQACDKTGPSDPIITSCISTCLAVMDLHMDAFLKIIYADMDPAKAVEMVEAEEAGEAPAEPAPAEDSAGPNLGECDYEDDSDLFSGIEPFQADGEKADHLELDGSASAMELRTQNIWGEMTDHTIENPEFPSKPESGAD